MIGLKLWNYWCALLITYMGCMEMKMGSLEIEIVSNFVLGELSSTPLMCSDLLIKTHVPTRFQDFTMAAA
jgi:hypothetical protein